MAAAKHPHRAMQRNNSSGINGIRLYWDRNKGGPPTLHVQASWSSPAGRLCSTHYSTVANGRIGATELALRARERGARERVGMSPRQAWARMWAKFQRSGAAGGVQR